MGHRRKAREIALQGLYMYDTVGTAAGELVKLAWVEDKPNSEIADFAAKIIRGTIEKVEEIDKKKD